MQPQVRANHGFCLCVKDPPVFLAKLVLGSQLLREHRSNSVRDEEIRGFKSTQKPLNLTSGLFEFEGLHLQWLTW